MSDLRSVDDLLQDPDVINFVLKDTFINKQFQKEEPYAIVSSIFTGHFTLVSVNKKDVSLLIEDIGSEIVSSIPLVLGITDSITPISEVEEQFKNQTFPALNEMHYTGKGVIVGIIDTGIDYTKSAFLYKDGTSRIKSILDLTIQNKSSDGFFTGTEYTNEQINKALKAENPYEVVPTKDTVGHGTFLASIAAGCEENKQCGTAPEAEFVIVKIQKAKPFLRESYMIPPEQENAFDSTSVMIGVEYILQKAKEYNLPASICIGLGTNSGSHDGFSILEEFLSEAANQEGVCICTAGGSECMVKHHTQGILHKNEDILPIEVTTGGAKENIYMSIYGSAADRFSVSLKSPNGELVDKIVVKSNTIFKSKLTTANTRVVIHYFYPLEESGGQLISIRIFDAIPGIWTIYVHGDSIINGTIHSWLPITGFVSPMIEFLNPFSYCTLVVPSTAIGTIACGAYDSLNNSLYSKSSWGPTRLPLMAPDFVAPGVTVTGVIPSGFGIMDGTGAAAASATGACALLLQWGVVLGNDKKMNTYHAKTYLIKGCDRDPQLTYPNTKWGYGRMNLMQTFNLLKEV